MRIQPDGSLYLEKGEVIPCVCCACGTLYPPKPGTLASECPQCGHVTIHEEQVWTARNDRA